MPRPLWSDGDQVTQADFDSMQARMHRQREALKAARFYIMGEALPTKAKALEMIDAALKP